VSDIEIEITFGREVQLDNGSGTTRAAMTLNYSTDISTDLNTIIETAREQFVEVKALIFTELGLAFNQEPGTGVVAEIFPGATPVANWEPLNQVVDSTLVQAASAQQQANANRMGNHIVPITGEPDLLSNEPTMPLPDPNTLTKWNDQCWYMLITAPDAWIDRRTSKSSDQFPDFVAKDAAQFPEKGVLGAPRAHGLYLKSKFGPAPAWVIDGLWMIEGRIEQA